MSELTPFSDGIGYMENAWSGLSDPQQESLFNAATYGAATGRATTRDVLRRYELIDQRDRLTERGRDLIAWVKAP